ncbi:MAG: hypothetical protein Q9221_005949 [Calogaya cf. arnoldii]
MGRPRASRKQWPWKWLPHGITVNAYAPGIVGTAMWDQIDEEMGKMKGVPKGETIKQYSHDLIALGRTSVPEDVPKTVSFLTGGDSDYMTGQTVVIDGGDCVYMILMMGICLALVHILRKAALYVPITPFL